MSKRKYYVSRFVLLILDIFVISIALYFFIKLQYKNNYIIKLTILPDLSEIIDAHFKAYFLLIFSWYFIAAKTKIYSVKRFNYLRETLARVLYQTFFFAIVFFTISGIKDEPLISTTYVVLNTFIILIYLVISRIIELILNKRFFSRDSNMSHSIIFGENNHTQRIVNKLKERRDFGIKIMNVYSNFKSEFLNKIDAKIIEKVFISQSSNITKHQENDIISFCEDNHIDVLFIPNSLESKSLNLEVEYIDTFPVFKIKKYPLDLEGNRFLKSTFDFFISLFVCLTILSWLFPIIAVLIILDSKGPIVFQQKRRGVNGREFNCFKFRTMRNDGTNSINATVVNDYRITKIGSLLRKTSLDELPQFLNVLIGDMSIIGPRPHMISQDKYYSDIIKKYNHRNYVKPGITGLAQVKGFRGAIDSDKDMEDRIRTDIFYVRNWSLLLDIQILYQTFLLIIKGDKNAI